MPPRFASALALGVALSACLSAGAQSGRGDRALPHRWVYVQTNLLVAENETKLEALMRRAARVGYNGVVLADYKLNILDTMDAGYFERAGRIRDLARELKMELIPCVCPIGYSGGILAHDPNLVEGMPVRDAPFVVRGHKADLEPDPAVAISNGGFEQSSGDRMRGFAFQDGPGQVSFADRQVKHSGEASLRFQDVGPATNGRTGNGRIVAAVTLKPHRYYRLSFWVKTQALDGAGGVNVTILPAAGGDRSLTYPSLGVVAEQDWVQKQVLFNSQSLGAVRIYIGIWGGNHGKLWLDDLALEEIGLVNVVRRAGCPLVVKGEDGTVFEEGRDFEPVKDPKMGVVPWPGEFELYHTPPSITLPAVSRIKDGQRLLVSFYHPAFVYDMQAACCLSDPKVYAILRDQMERVERLFHPTAVFFGHDEIRAANWCELCRSRNTTPGELLADNVRRCIAIARDVSPEARIYVWSDMFDPYHNAKDNYYLVNGTWAGSWAGLTPDVGIVDWLFDARKQDLPWFAARGHQQVLAGYYDNEVGYTRTWLDEAHDVKGIVGAMYTTWQSKYDELEHFADVVWGGARRAP